MEQTKNMAPPRENSVFATEHVGRLLMKFAVPAIISMLVNSLYNVVDQIFIGQGVGYLGNAATNVAFPLVTICLAFSLLVGDGTAAFFSLKLGAGEKEQARWAAGNGLTLSVIAGVIFAVLSLVFLDPILRLCGATENVYNYARDYTSITIIGLPFVVVSITMSCIMRADGSPKYAMVCMLVGAVLNTMLDPLFIFVFHWGVRGAAIATVIGQFVNFLISLNYLRRFKSVKPDRACFRPHKETVRGICTLGISSFITQMAATVVIIVVNRSIVYYGAQSVFGSDIPLSVTGIIMKVNQIVMSILIGLSVGAQPIIGFNYGARQYRRVKHTYRVAVTVAGIWSFVSWCAFQFLTQPIVNIFGQHSQEYNTFALMGFRVFLMLLLIDGFTIISSNFFQAIGKPVKAIILSLSRQFAFFIPAVLILPLFYGIYGVIYAGPVTDGLAFILAGILVILEMRHLSKKALERPLEETGLDAAAEAPEQV